MRPRSETAFTITELLVLVGVLALVMALVVPSYSRAKARAQRIRCTSHLKQIGLAAKIWGLDNGDLFPSEVTADANGALEAVKEGNITVAFLVMSNELSTPLVLTCPSDDRKPQRTFAALAGSNISYFWGVDVSSNRPSAWHAGDRNLTNRPGMAGGLLVVSSNDPAAWTPHMHNRQGNIALGDGSVEQLSTAALLRYPETNRILLP